MLYKSILTTFSLVASASARPPRSQNLDGTYTYAQYLKDFGKVGSKDGQFRFESRLKTILEHNQDPNRSYSQGVNVFTDEVAPPKGRSPAPSASRGSALDDARVLDLIAGASPMPASVDWRDAGVVSEVKNQGHCKFL